MSFVSSDIEYFNIDRGDIIILSLLAGAIKLTPLYALILAIIIFATGIAPLGEYAELKKRKGGEKNYGKKELKETSC